MQDPIHHAGAIAGRDRRAQSEQLVECQAKAIDVASAVDAAAESFGSHVSERADDVSLVCQLAGIVRLGQPEVRDPGRADGVEQDIRGLDVPMHDALLVGICERLGDLQTDPRDAPDVGQVRPGRQLGTVA